MICKYFLVYYTYFLAIVATRVANWQIKNKHAKHDSIIQGAGEERSLGDVRML